MRVMGVGLRLLVIVLVCAPALAARVLGVEALGVTVRDLDRSIAYYRDVLAFELMKIEEDEGETLEHVTGVFAAHTRTATMRLGSETIELTQFLAPEGRSVPETWRSCDQWFQHIAIVVRDMDEAYEALRRASVRHASPSPQTLPEWNRSAGGIRAFYFKDPDGHALEIIWFPDGKGHPRWREPTERLFLGIDHTAIVVRDIERSLEFYRDMLGLRVVGESRNHGPEQERLNSVLGASLRITALRAAHGPGVELLEYIEPRDCEPFPSDLAANDLAHWQIVVSVDEVTEAAEDVVLGGGRRVSAAVTASVREGRAGVLFRDPDGHAVLALQASEGLPQTRNRGDIVR